MLASVGYLVGESFHPLFGGEVTGAANTHLAQVQEIAPSFFFALAVAIGISETTRALIGWVPPVTAMTSNYEKGERGAFGALLRDIYYPGDIGFDPLGLKPSDPKEFAEIQVSMRWCLDVLECRRCDLFFYRGTVFFSYQFVEQHNI